MYLNELQYQSISLFFFIFTAHLEYWANFFVDTFAVKIIYVVTLPSLQIHSLIAFLNTSEIPFPEWYSQRR